MPLLTALGCQGVHNGLCDSLGWQGGDFAFSASFLILNENTRAGVATNVRIKVMQDTGDQRPLPGTTPAHCCSSSQGNTCLIPCLCTTLGATFSFSLVNHPPLLIEIWLCDDNQSYTLIEVEKGYRSEMNFKGVL